MSHDPASCRRCESVPPEKARRHWKHEPKAGAWHVIAEAPDLMARLPRQAHFATVLAYTPAPNGTRHYQGPLYWEHDADDLDLALEDLRRGLRLLEIEYACALEAVHVWHSGGRGYHVTIPALVVGAEAGHPQLPRIYAAIMAELFPRHVAPSLDRSVYSGGTGRMWRLPNRRRTDTGRCKVPLSMREALHASASDLDAMTRHPRQGRDWPGGEELSPCPALIELYHATAAMIEQAP
jgi:hypothetical protein